MVKYITEKTLVITPGDRIDNILVSVALHLNRPNERFSIAGLALTGGLIHHSTVLEMLQRSRLPALLCPEDTYTTSSHIREMVFEIRSDDKDKISAAQGLIAEHVDLSTLFG